MRKGLFLASILVFILEVLILHVIGTKELTIRQQVSALMLFLMAITMFFVSALWNHRKKEKDDSSKPRFSFSELNHGERFKVYDSTGRRTYVKIDPPVRDGYRVYDIAEEDSDTMEIIFFSYGELGDLSYGKYYIKI